MSNWFGKNCKHQCCQWEETEETGGPDYREQHPSLIFCDHKDNTDDCEGNCNIKRCPEQSSIQYAGVSKQGVPLQIMNLYGELLE